jgi:nitrate reductase assembly molybdenum cofactor insertion protein NarJ
VVGQEEMMDALEHWEAERMLEEALARGMRRLRRKERQEKRKRPYRELAAVLRKYLDDEPGLDEAGEGPGRAAM